MRTITWGIILYGGQVVLGIVVVNMVGIWLLTWLGTCR